MDKILSVKQLKVSFRTYGGESNVLRGVSFHLNKGETLAIVGESGSGKSVTAKAIMKLLPKKTSFVNKGEVIFGNKNLLELGEREMQKIRGSEISMVFQDPMTSLNPTMTIGKQIMEGLRVHQPLSKKEAFIKAVELLEMVGIPNAVDRMKEYPHQFSGGMRQRVVVAIAIACSPKILIADEPTTALDVTIQAQILDLMKNLQQQLQTAIIIITHDLGVVANMAQRVAVMYAGEIIEIGTVDEIFYEPKHPYTWGLLESMPKLHEKQDEPLIPISGSPPDLSQLPEGCPFALRCPYAMKVCHKFVPEPTIVSKGHYASCWLLDQRAANVERIGVV
ncbi:ABC transporter ATP-binding protein [Bacillus sp. V33-4]|uniref:ABC transporter ATP-binding protein n=1 Tax=Bacillus sp. V33-4 TaxID=2054169 RepID=UPI000C78F321|nr:ABC transporter ATP-binding protein [Bacillus sp. V33-4]PLR81475.1 peptide ABC transporter ATP-binding protein [Bacillus sp. V33-4]